jgi:hypothetical protein
MFKKIFLAILLLNIVFAELCLAQNNNSTEALFHREESGGNRIGQLKIYQDPRIDTLINRHILYNLKQQSPDGFRIQIYSRSDKDAREESGKKEAEFISKFPDIKSYPSFERPGYYKIRVGNFRTKTEGTKDLLMIRRVFPDAYLVPDKIHFPDLN